MRIARIALHAAALTLLAGVAQASSEAGTSKVVRIGGLDLKRPEHRDRLTQRVSSAAYYVCTHDARGVFRGPPASFRKQCHAEVMDALRDDLAALFDRKDTRVAATLTVTRASR